MTAQPRSPAAPQPRSPSLQLLHRPRPILFQQPRQCAVREEPPFRLTARTVVRLVVAIADALHGRATYGAGETIAAMDRHVVAERRDLLGEFVAGLGAKTSCPVEQRRASGVIEARDFFVAQPGRELERRQA